MGRPSCSLVCISCMKLRAPRPSRCWRSAGFRFAIRTGRSPPWTTSFRPTGRNRPYVDGMAEQMFVAIEQNVEQTGIPFFRPLHRPPGHRARHRAGTRSDPAWYDDRLRRQSHEYARRLRGHCLRYRHLAGSRRAGHADHLGGQAAVPAYLRQRQARRRRVRQGRDPGHHRAAGRTGRGRLCLRVRRRRV